MASHPRRLILWDIDGTLLSAGPVAREAFDAAVAKALGRDPAGHGIQMSGKTDPQIALEIMETAGVTGAEAHRRLPRGLRGLEQGLVDGVDRCGSTGRSIRASPCC